MSEQQLLSEKLAIELEKVKSDCPEFSYAPIGQTSKKMHISYYLTERKSVKSGLAEIMGIYIQIFSQKKKKAK